MIQGNEISFTEDVGDQCAGPGGAGVYLLGAIPTPSGVPPYPPLLLGNTIEENTASGTEDSFDLGGAGVYIVRANPTVQNNVIRNNATASGWGGAINMVTGGGIYIDNLIYGNSAGCGGGAISTNTDPDSQGDAALFINNTIVGNNTTDSCGITGGGDGRQIYIWLQSNTMKFSNNIITDSFSKSAIYCDPTYDGGSSQTTAFDHNDVFHPNGSRYDGGCNDQTGTNGNISVDPQFSSTAESNYHLQRRSPAIDVENDGAPTCRPLTLMETHEFKTRRTFLRDHRYGRL